MSRNTRLEHNTPADIERTSFAIIGEELEARGIALPPETEPVVKRVIHTTADFDYAANLRFTENAVERGGLALRSGCTIVTDTNMARAGISKPALQKLGGDLVCYMADPAVAARAKEEGTTRATVSMAVAAEEHPDAVFAIGNAPTALFALDRLIRETDFSPALVIGVPVGFVNVVEGKETLFATCEARGIPAIFAMGRKGGSNVAAAICNALLYRAAHMPDPKDRGWN